MNLEGQINLDNLFHDQVTKLHVPIFEFIFQNDGEKIFLPVEYILDCSILIQTDNNYNLEYSLTRRVSHPYFKNFDKVLIH